MRKQIWVSPHFAVKLKQLAAVEEKSIVSLTEELAKKNDYDFFGGKIEPKKKKPYSMFPI